MRTEQSVFIFKQTNPAEVATLVWDFCTQADARLDNVVQPYISSRALFAALTIATIEEGALINTEQESLRVGDVFSTVALPMPCGFF